MSSTATTLGDDITKVEQKTPSPRSPPRVMLVCSGLDHARRGFESFARECFEALRDEPGIRIELVKASGARASRERVVPTLKRDQALTRGLGRAVGSRPFRIEALVFGFSLTPLITRRRPDVIFVSEWDTARALAWIRSVTRLRFKLLLSNGSMAFTGFDHLDCVQELTPAAYEYVIARGDDPTRHVQLPLGFAVEPSLRIPSPNERAALRVRMGLPPDRRIIVSVAALNRQHKRLDYVINELASLPAPRPFLLLLGQPEEDTPGLRALAGERLGEADHSIRTVPADEVADYCRASDAFVLASLYEGLPRALVEASALGLPCFAHRYPVSEYALGPQHYCADLRERGALAELISGLSDADLFPQGARARHAYAYEHFSWDRLRPRYVRLFEQVASGEVGAPPSAFRVGLRLLA